MIKKINLNGRTVAYDLQRKKVKNVNLRIKADRTIYVSANDSVSDAVIEEFLLSKAEYIIKALNHYEELAHYAPKPKHFVDGESFRILGHDRRLRVIKEKKNAIESDEAYILLTVKDPTDFIAKQRMMDRWIAKLCRETITSLCQSIYPKFEKYGVSFPIIRFRNMISRWGSCQPKRGVLTFNYALVEAPISCIEYVVVHEFTHFLHPNHSRKFYQQLSMFMPDWEERKRILEKGSAWQE